jgi:hypothetical protein
MAKKRGFAKNPYAWIVVVLALTDFIFGNQIQAWIKSLPDGWRYAPILVGMVAIAAAFIVIAYFSRGKSDG